MKISIKCSKLKSRWVVVALAAMALMAFMFIWKQKNSSAKKIPKTIELLIWQDYISPKLVANFQKEFDCKVEITFYGSNDELLEILRNESRPDADVIVPSSYSLEILNQEAFLEPVKVGVSRAWDDMDQDLLGRFNLMGFKGKGIPYMIAPTGIALRRIPSDDEGVNTSLTWNSLFEIENRDRKISILEDKREAIAASLLAMNQSCDLVDKKSIKAACENIQRAVQSGAMLDANAYHYKLINKDLRIAHAWPGDVMPFEEEIEFHVPEEGHVVTCDFLCVLRSSNNKELAWKFVNYVSRPNNASSNMEWCQYRSPVRKAYETSKGKLRHPSLHLKPESGKEYKGKVLPSISREVDDMINQYWMKITK